MCKHTEISERERKLDIPHAKAFNIDATSEGNGF